MRNVVEMELSKLKPYANNPRSNIQAIDVVKKSIMEFGFTNPILVDQHNVIIAGHTRYIASKEMGLDIVPVIVIKDLSDEQVKAYRIMDNKSGDYAEWDYIKLLAEIEEITNYDVAFTGFDLMDIEKLKIEFEIEELPEIRIDLDENGEEIEESPTHVIQYNIIFNNEMEQDIWFDHLKALKIKYPELDTIAERIIADLG